MTPKQMERAVSRGRALRIGPNAIRFKRWVTTKWRIVDAPGAIVRLCPQQPHTARPNSTAPQRAQQSRTNPSP